jgi:hypothetical protein
MSSSAAPFASPSPIEERQKKVKGIDFPRAYHALIKGFVQVQTARKLKDLRQTDEAQGAQR